ncbi:MAG TPA: Ig-like domain-containing protein [Methylomirabilota bacterium]|nr:Ig-like domain-containing protein [Methylomirabilota bacterium]
MVLSFTLVIAFSSQQASTQAGPEQAPLIPESLLPQGVGIGIASEDAVRLPFDASMDPASVEAAVQILPEQELEMSWNDDYTELTLRPARLWRTEEQYLAVVAASAQTEAGESLAGARRYSFTTQIAPHVSDFQIRVAGAALPPDVSPADAVLELDSLARTPAPTDDGSLPPSQTATAVSATSAISITFSEAMNTADVEDHFAITPHVDGELSWDGDVLVFEPAERLEQGSRYTISVIGSHDRTGNLIGGKGNFSFIVQPGAQVTKSVPVDGATDVEPATVEVWFSQAMDVEATNDAFTLIDTTSGQSVAGQLDWNEAGTQLVYTPDNAFGAGRTFEVSVAEGARDSDGNGVTASWSFTTKAPPPPPPPPAPARATTSTRSAPSVPAAAPATSLAGYALNQVNAARAAYGFAPVALDASISAVAASHAWDMAQHGYFSHYGRNGSSRQSRLAAGGVSFGWSGENLCAHGHGWSQQAVLDWCHSVFMAEPYPGYWNHKANILSPNARRMGVGIATANGRTVIVWDFTD